MAPEGSGLRIIKAVEATAIYIGIVSAALWAVLLNAAGMILLFKWLFLQR